MKLKIILFVLISSWYLFGTTYYVSSSGNDANNGTSTGTPWLTIAKVNTINFNPGDQILFKRGDTWTAQQLIIDRSGSSGNNIIFGSYGTGARPVLSGGNTLGKVLSVSANVHHIKIIGIKFRDMNPSVSYAAIIFLDQVANNITIDSCDFSQSLKTIDQWKGMIVGRDVHHITIQNSDFTGGIAAICMYPNWSNSHNDVHHIDINNNKFHRISTRANELDPLEGVNRSCALWGMVWWSSSGVATTFGNVLGQEGIFRDISFTYNDIDSIHSFAINILRAPLAYHTYPETSLYPAHLSYNFNISYNDFNLLEAAAIEVGFLSNRNGVNHPETGVPIEWSVIEQNRIDSTGYNYVTKNPGLAFTLSLLSVAIEIHAAKQLLIQDNDISWSAAWNGDGHGINLDFSPGIASEKIPCDSVIIRRNLIHDILENNTQTLPGKSSGCGIQFAVINKDIEVYNNVIYNIGKTNAGARIGDAGGAGISWMSWSLGTYWNPTTVKVVNNTIYNCEKGFGAVTGFILPGILAGNIIRNNIFVKCTKGWQGTGINVASGVAGNNLYYLNTYDYYNANAGTNDVIGDPVFKNTSEKDFHINNSTGAGINKAVSILLKLDETFPYSSYTRNVDFDGNPVGTSPDIGAYEFGTVTPVAPIITEPINDADNIAQTSARISAFVNVGFQSTTVTFKWDIDSVGSWANTVTAAGSPFLSDVTASFNLSALVPNTTYYYKAFAVNASGNDSSFAKSFTTLPVPSNPPSIDSIYVTSLSQTTVTLNAEINTGGLSTFTRFQWDTDSLTWANNQPANNSPFSSNGLASRNITGLTTSTLYYYRAFVTNGDGSDTSFVKSFTTAAAPSPLPTLPDNFEASANASYTFQDTIRVQASGFDANTDSLRVNFMTTDYPANRYAGITLYAGIDTNAVNNDLFINTTIDSGETAYVRVWVYNESGWNASSVSDTAQFYSEGVSIFLLRGIIKKVQIPVGEPILLDTFYMDNSEDDIMYYSGATNANVSRFGETVPNGYRGIEQIYKDVIINFNLPIESAVLEVKANVSGSIAVVGDMYYDTRDNPTAPLSYSDFNNSLNFSLRSTQYSAPSYVIGNFYQIDVKDLIQGRVSETNWNNGENIGIIIKGDTALTNNGYREITRAENSLTDNKLIIRYQELISFSTFASGGDILTEGDVYLKTQAQVDSFGAFNYTSLYGSLYLGNDFEGNSDITNFNAISELTYIRDNFYLVDALDLTNISGLSNITFVGGVFAVSVTNLTNLNDFINLETVGSVFITSNPNIIDVNGLAGITTILNKDIRFEDNIILDSIKVFSNIDTLITLASIGNTKLINLSGFSNLSFINDIVISTNDSLTNLNFLGNINKVSKDLVLSGNASLSNIDSLINITEIGGILSIEANNLTNLNGLSNLTKIGLDILSGTGGLSIFAEPDLTNLNGLSNLIEIGGNLDITNNPALNEFCGLYNLLNIDGLVGTYTVTGNLTNPNQATIIAGGACL